jgi:predicted Zn-dependent peptidase
LRQGGYGLTLITSRSYKHVESVYIELIVQVGGRNDDGKHFGLAHFTEHVLGEVVSAKLRRHDWINDYMLDLFDASTDQEKTTYYIACAKEDVGKSLTLLLPLLDNFHISTEITAELIKQEKAVVAEEILGYYDEEVAVVRQHLAHEYYGDNSLGRGTALGDLDTIKTFTVEHVQQFINQYYRPNNSFLVVAGNLESGNIAKQVENMLRVVLPAHAELSKRRDAKQPPNICANRLIYLPRKTQQNMLAMIRPLQIRDSAQAIEIMVLSGMLKQYLEFHGRNRGLFYYLSVTYYPYRDHFSFIIESSFSPEKTVEFHEWLTKSLRQFQQELNETTVELYKQNLLNNTRLELPYPRTTLDNLSWYYYYFQELVTVDIEMKYIEGITADQLVQLYHRLYQTREGVVLISGQITEEMKRSIRRIPLPGT